MAKSPEAQAAEINLKFVAITRAQIDLFWVIATKDNSDFDGKLDEAVSDSGDSSYFD
jgi:hypothetical protein